MRSKYKGVRWIKRSRRWVAEIYLNGETKCIGYFNNDYEAAEAYQNEITRVRSAFP